MTEGTDGEKPGIYDALKGTAESEGRRGQAVRLMPQVALSAELKKLIDKNENGELPDYNPQHVARATINEIYAHLKRIGIAGEHPGSAGIVGMGLYGQSPEELESSLAKAVAQSPENALQFTAELGRRASGVYNDVATVRALSQTAEGYSGKEIADFAESFGIQADPERADPRLAMQLYALQRAAEEDEKQRKAKDENIENIINKLSEEYGKAA